MRAEELPAPTYTVPELEAYLELPSKTAYKLIRDGKLPSHKDVTGKARVSYGDLYTYMKNK